MARFLLEHEILFQHIPRTGGTWVEQALAVSDIECIKWLQKQPEDLPRKHALISHYWPRERGRAKGAFCFVRHPVALYYSVWKWLCKQTPEARKTIEGRWKWHPKASISKLYDPDYNKWVEAVLKHEPAWVTRWFEIYCGPDGGEFMSYIGRTESLQQDFAEAMIFFGYGGFVDHAKLAKIGRINTTPDIIVELDPSLQQELEHVERLAINRFYGPETRHLRFYAEVATRSITDVAG